jgi:hypothetical protein
MFGLLPEDWLVPRIAISSAAPETQLATTAVLLTPRYSSENDILRTQA